METIFGVVTSSVSSSRQSAASSGAWCSRVRSSILRAAVESSASGWLRTALNNVESARVGSQ
eukprot:5430642-Prymnesium_polylepis.2